MPAADRRLMRARKARWINGWQIKTWIDWLFTGVSFILFLGLETALLYAYYMFLQTYVK